MRRSIQMKEKKMTRPLHLVAVSGGLQRPSRSAVLAAHLLDLIAGNIPCEQRLVELGQLAPQLAGAVRRSQLPDTVERELAAVEQADVLVIDHQLRPLFSFFQARTLPLGVYATDKDFADYRVRDEALIQRARLAVQRALPLVELARRSKSSPAEEAALA
jgi:FMN reductase